jgi:hypothetical protein
MDETREEKDEEIEEAIPSKYPAALPQDDRTDSHALSMEEPMDAAEEAIPEEAAETEL